MPHLCVEYSDNLTDFPEAALLAALNAAVAASGELQAEHDLKSRIAPCRQYRVGTDAQAARGFVHAELRWMSGRSPEVKRSISDRIAAVLREHTPHPAGMLVQLSVDIVDMDRAAYFKGRL